jgi:hypothetical protein
MRILLVLALTLVAALSSACFHRGRGSTYRRVTGTCAGACDHYLRCKAERGHDVDALDKSACATECGEVFSGSEPLVAFERLSCEDAIAFVEGESGRGPGVMSTAAPPIEPSADSEASGQRASSEPASSEPASDGP